MKVYAVFECEYKDTTDIVLLGLKAGHSIIPPDQMEAAILCAKRQFKKTVLESPNIKLSSINTKIIGYQ